MGFLVWATIGVGMYQISNSSENTTDGFLAAKAKSFITPHLDPRTEPGHKTYWVPSLTDKYLNETHAYWQEKFNQKAVLFKYWTWDSWFWKWIPIHFLPEKHPMRVLRSQHSISDDNEGTGTGISGNVSGVSITYASRSEMSIKTFTLDVEMTDTIQIVKTKIQNKVSIPADRQKLSFGRCGRDDDPHDLLDVAQKAECTSCFISELLEDGTLDSHNITKGSQLK